MKTILPLLIIFLFNDSSVNATPRIAILDFELNDITSLPNTQQELIRTASVKPLLEKALVQKSDVEIIVISGQEQKQENAGFGYLFRFHDIAAKLGKQVGADWILVGQHSKPSFLYSYLIVYLVNVQKGKSVARYDIELKGNHQRVTQHAVKRLAKDINRTLISGARIQ